MSRAEYARSSNLALRLVLIPALALVGCATGETGKSLMPTRFQARSGPYTVHTNFPLPQGAPELRQLASLERQIESTLGLKVDAKTAPIEVFILDDRKSFAHFLTYYCPGLPQRRAFFLAQGDRRLVYAYRGDLLEVDLRHEATHALLHAAVGSVPLWLDEGLAEYFESPLGDGGANPEHLDRLKKDLASGWAPGLKTLEDVKDVRKMTPRDYREAWAWTHFFLTASPSGKSVLLAYLADLRSGGDVPPLSERFEERRERPDDGLLAHLAAQRSPTLRLQDDPPPPGSPPNTDRIGFFRRIGRFLGLGS